MIEKLAQLLGKGVPYWINNPDYLVFNPGHEDLEA
jgi:hypothetical protein